MKKDHLWIALICIVLGVVLSQQLKLVQRDVLQGSNPRQKSTELAAELQVVKTEKEALLNQLSELEKQLAEIEESESRESLLVKNMNDQINKLRNFSGLSDVTGTGVVIMVDNPPKDLNYTYESNILYDYDLLLALINELNSAGAEAIAINGQRIVAMSEIRTAGNAVNINMVPQTAPFRIEVIGNADTLEGAVNQRFGIVSQMRERRYLVEVKKSDKVVVPKYSGIIELKYARPVEE